MEAQEVVVDLGDDGKLAVFAEPLGGPELVSNETVTAALSDVTGPIAKVSKELLNAARQAAPQKAVVEVSFGLAVEQGQLISLLAKGRGEAGIKITLEWSSTES
jgi:hypothetical protein